MRRKAMRSGSTSEMEWAAEAKKSYCRCFKVWRPKVPVAGLSGPCAPFR